MKKTLLLTAACICIAAHSQAQISKGTIFLGGTLSASSYNSSSSDSANSFSQKNTSYSIAPMFGIAVSDNEVIGFSLSYAHQASLYNPDPTHAGHPGNVYGAGIYYRKYRSLSKQFYFFAEENVSAGFFKQEYFSDYATNSKRKITGWQSSLGIYPGIAYAVNSRLFLEAGINNLISINSSTTKQEDSRNGTVIATQKSSSFSLDYDFSRTVPFTLGFRIALRKNK